ncbi:MAG TPA: adenylosuccinate synthase [Candidatus Acidoferrales bacterium]|jgi:adenylosuccinate synthase|nr:adenylosuccinate synthase [Candidatus Acidoferrales bacterium]
MNKPATKAVVVVGAQWGDEGKGKVVDYVASSFDYIARYAGGHNAGHTVIFDGHRYVLQLIPSGILRPGKKAVIGPGTVVDPAALVAELENLKKSGIEVRGRLFLSNRAHLIFPYHREMDKAAESARGAAKIGTTSRGIGPAYEDKMARRGIRMCDLLDADRFREKLERVILEKNAISHATYGHPLETAGLLEQYLELAAHMRGLVIDTTELLNAALDKGESVLFEGAQGTMLDIDHGTYPYVTSSNATSGGVATGLGVAPTRLTGVVGVTKAYTTRVGSGPFPTEMPDLDAQAVRERGNEFGAVTGRPRRCGWLDLPVLRYAKMINGIDSLVVTKLDVFDAQPEIKVCTGYRYKGQPITEMPPDVETLSLVEPDYKTLPGWRKPTPGIRDVKELPTAARDYLNFISDHLQVEIGMISTGPERDATIVPRGTKLASWL